MTRSAKNIEILAPAGNMVALHAAVCGGANAVYLGLDHFNARRGADNFSLDNLDEAVRYAHLRGVKIYLTFNIAVFESELKQAISYAKAAAKCGVDAFIVQDVGLCLALREKVFNQFPSTALHISTQMNIHNIDGLRHVARLGAKRVTLARELSIDEIKNICSEAYKLGVEIEVFGHGALCICYSGQCLMSSMIGGRSANRGTCAQACRLNYDLGYDMWSTGNRRYEQDEKRGYYLLSPKDLCSIEKIAELYDAGASSIKIEGRMKSPEYVYAVASSYAKAAESLHTDNTFDFQSEKDKLSKVFSRGFSESYLIGCRDNSMMSYMRPNNRGVSIGRVSSVKKDYLSLETRHILNLGDIVEIWTSKGRSVIKIDGKWKISPRLAESKIDMSKEDNRHVRRGDRVFLVRDSKSAFNDSDFEPKIKITGRIELNIGKPLKLIVQTLDTSKYKCEVTAAEVEEAKSRPVTKDDIFKHIARTGNTPFEFVDIEINLQENVGLSFSALHHIRAEALEKLEKLILDNFSAHSCICED